MKKSRLSQYVDVLDSKVIVTDDESEFDSLVAKYGGGSKASNKNARRKSGAKGQRNQRKNSTAGLFRRDYDDVRTVSFGDARGRKRAAQRAYRAAQAASEAKLEALTAQPDTEMRLPEPLPKSKMWGEWKKHGLWGPTSTGAPWHTTSAARIGLLSPFLAAKSAVVPGPIVGLETATHVPFTFDPWSAVAQKLVTSPGVVVIGLMGKGKSYCVKLVMIRLIENGRQVIVSSDPKGEWIIIAEALGGQIVEIGPGSGNIINPLDEGTRPATTSVEAWRRTVVARRALALQAICHILRPHQPLDAEEMVCLDQVVVDIADGLVAPTIQAVVARLETPPVTLTEKVGVAAPRTLALMLGRLCFGPLSGMFDTESTVQLDPQAPMVVMSTKYLGTGKSEVKEIASAVTAAWIDATLRSGDGRFRCIVSEEGWDELRNPALAEAMDQRLRLTSEWRCSNWLIIHELSDINQLAAEGSAHRNIVEGIITRSETKILYCQNQASMEAIDRYIKPTSSERKELTRLGQGVGIWHVGQETPTCVYPIAGEGLRKLLTTDAGRNG